ncbi:MAG: stage II sporulation protein M [Bacilli bacterium]|nr:stage II sporulation protein M [Bacilli bacterium]
MSFFGTSPNKYLIKFLLSLLIIGVLVGIYVYLKQPNLVKTSIINELTMLNDILKNTNQNNFIYHILLLSLIIFLSIIIIGLPFILFYLFYEGISIGFLIASFFHYQKISGLLYSLIFTLINKLIIYVALIYILIITINYSKKVVLSIKRKDYKIYEYLFTHLVRMIFICLIILIYDIFIYFFGNKILLYFIFLL